MANLASLLVLAALSTNAPVATRDSLDKATGFAVGLSATSDPLEIAYEQLLAQDDAAQEGMDRWIQEADAQGDAANNAELQKRIDARIAEVDSAYRDFLAKHPDHVRARIAYGSFLSDTGRESQGRDEWEKALQLDPKNPAIYNNLAGYFGHRGPVTNAFVYFEKAIELGPKESEYYQNLATAVYLYRRDVMEHYGITDEQKVFDKALGLYRRAQELDPTNFILATDLAQTYYGIKPLRSEEALKAWLQAYELASDDLEREGVRVHLARVYVQAGRHREAREQLNLITNSNFTVVRDLIWKTMERKERETAEGPDSPNRNPATVKGAPAAEAVNPRP